jgi:hypothetical protein
MYIGTLNESEPMVTAELQDRCFMNPESSLRVLSFRRSLVCSH